MGEAMKIRIQGRDVELTELLRARTERRLGFALGRCADRIGRVWRRATRLRGRSDGREFTADLGEEQS
jgi:ribosome-associated translation inhibitor RaiA